MIALKNGMKQNKNFNKLMKKCNKSKLKRLKKKKD